MINLARLLFIIIMCLLGEKNIEEKYMWMDQKWKPQQEEHYEK